MFTVVRGITILLSVPVITLYFKYIVQVQMHAALLCAILPIGELETESCISLPHKQQASRRCTAATAKGSKI